MPLHQTEQDGVVQREVLERLRAAAGFLRIEEMPQTCAFDGKCYRDTGLSGLVEVKGRRIGPRQFKTIFCDEAKWNAIREACAEYGVPAILLVQFRDGSLRWAEITGEPPDVRVRSVQQERHDPYDTGRVAHVPVDWFRAVKEKGRPKAA